MATFPTKTEVKAVLGTSSSENDTVIDALLVHAIAEFKNKANNPVTSASYVEQFEVSRVKKIVLYASPITAITHVKLEDTTLDTDDYTVYDEQGTIEFDYVITGTIEVSYTAGYASDAIPADIIKAVIMQVIAWMQKVKDRLGKKSISVGGVSVALVDEPFIPEFEDTCQRYYNPIPKRTFLSS